jgi:D-alanine-D-alanine ligase
MAKIRVGVLRGGLGHEYEVSLSTGGAVLQHMPAIYQAVDVLITKDGTWHVAGIPILPAELPKYTDVAFNALHGEYGEDGQIQRFLDELNLPYTGSGHFASALGMNKIQSKKIFKDNDIKSPYGIDFKYIGGLSEDYAKQIFTKMSPPWVVKPADRGSSVGVSVAKTYDELVRAIFEAFSCSDNILIEEYIKGKEATCGVVDKFRKNDIYSLPPIEIRKPSGSTAWSYDDKYSGITEEVCPGCFSPDEKAQIEELAKKVHQVLGLRHYSRTDFIVSPRGVYVLETNTLPGLTQNSLLPKSLDAVGCSYPQFIDHLITLALNK